MHHTPLVLVCTLLMPLILLSKDLQNGNIVSKKASTPADQLTTLDSIISVNYKENDAVFIEKSIAYINLALKEKAYQEAAEKAIDLQDILGYRQKKSKKAINILNRILSHKDKLKDSCLIGKLYFKRGKSHAAIDPKQAIADYQLAIRFYREGSYENIGNSYLYAGHANLEIGNYIDAIVNYEKAYSNYKNTENKEYVLYPLRGKIKLYSLIGFYEKAEAERNEYFKKSQELGIQSGLSAIYYHQAIDFRKTGKLDLEIKALENALLYLNESSSEFIKIGIQAKMLENHLLNGYYNKAKEPFNYLKKINPSTLNEDIKSKIVYNAAMGVYHSQYGNNETALQYALKRKNAALQLNNENELKDAYFLLAKIYESAGNHKIATSNYKEYLNIKDTLHTRNNELTKAFYRTQYEAEKKEKELVKKNKDIELLESKNKSFKKQVIFISIISLFLFGVILLFRNQKHLRLHKKLQEQFSQELIVSQEKERIRISKDLHDGIGQLLLLIKNKLINLGNNEAKVMVDQAIDEVRTISRDLHPFHLQEMGITKAIKNVLFTIDENTSLFISLEIDNIDHLFTPEQEVNIYRIVQETLNNIIKHAKAEACKVSIMRLSKLIVITIKDNGIGFDFNEKFQKVKSMGLKTLLERTKFLNGQMKVQSYQNNGTLIEFQIPLILT